MRDAGKSYDASHDTNTKVKKLMLKLKEEQEKCSIQQEKIEELQDELSLLRSGADESNELLLALENIKCDLSSRTEEFEQEIIRYKEIEKTLLDQVEQLTKENETLRSLSGEECVVAQLESVEKGEVITELNNRIKEQESVIAEMNTRLLGQVPLKSPDVPETQRLNELQLLSMGDSTESLEQARFSVVSEDGNQFSIVSESPATDDDNESDSDAASDPEDLFSINPSQGDMTQTTEASTEKTPGFFSRLFQRKHVPQAHFEEETSFIYDPVSKKWVDQNAPTETLAVVTKPLPRPMSLGGAKAGGNRFSSTVKSKYAMPAALEKTVSKNMPASGPVPAVAKPVPRTKIAKSKSKPKSTDKNSIGGEHVLMGSLALIGQMELLISELEALKAGRKSSGNIECLASASVSSLFIT